VKKSGDLAGRLGAWWNGVDYAAPSADGEAKAEEKPAKAEKKAEKKPEKAEKPAAEEKPEAKPEPEVKAAAPAPAPEAKPQPAPETPALTEAFSNATPNPALTATNAAVRVKALETLWGEGRLGPGSAEIDAKLLDAALEHADKLGGIGFIGADAALLNAFGTRSDRSAHAAEWRNGAFARVKELAGKAAVELCDIDRPRGFGESALEAVISCEAFAFADHKNGLVNRVHRALSANGRWVFLDTTRNTARAPAEAFASAWAEPQLSTNDDIEEILKLSGFGAVQKIPVTELVLNAARAGYHHLASILETAAQQGLKGREGALYLQELAWEAQSWRARVRALEGGALDMNLWIADKLAPLELTQEAVSDELLETAIKPDDAGASETLFDKA
jgi:hypothetical protein